MTPEAEQEYLEWVAVLLWLDDDQEDMFV